jgi:hypothetical protein
LSGREVECYLRVVTGPERFPWIMMAGMAAFTLLAALESLYPGVLDAIGIATLALGIAGWFALAPLFVRIGTALPKIPRRSRLGQAVHLLCVACFCAMLWGRPATATVSFVAWIVLESLLRPFRPDDAKALAAPGTAAR